MALIKTPKQIQALREGGKILANAMAVLIDAVRPGMTTNDLDALFVKTIQQHGAESSFLGYRGYPKSICTSINDEVVHAIPGKRVIAEGDILSLDCGVRFKGFCTDMARTIPVGIITAEAQKLIRITEESLRLGVQELVPDNTIGDIGAAIQTYVEAENFSVVRVLVGHGVGEDVHEEPQVPNYGQPHTGPRLAAGMVLAIEPMVNIGSARVVFEDDGWTVRTFDGTLSAHFEDTIVITERGPEILTQQ
ncbi:MAG: type I methionyl aminopeptidase [Candidatus Kerfeldbacteria bacterium]|nr:type I methionyl aminopeptidase [Candidatus Kerfeldbacteria bacterium]